jgi:hypothetical protein
MLADAIAALKAAQEHFDRERAPAEALEQVIAGADRAEANLARFQAERMRAIGAWLLDGQQGERPSPGKDEARAEHEARRARTDATAAESVLPAASRRRQVAQSALAEAAQRCKEMVCAVAAEAALALAPVLADKLHEALQVQETMEAVVRTLRAEADAGRLPMSPAGNAAERILEAIRTVRGEAAVVRDDATGLAFINHAAADAAATLQH